MAAAEKRALKEGRTIVFCDQSGFYLLPMVVLALTPRWEGRPSSMSISVATTSRR